MAIEQLHERLRTWARGSLPCQAAVEFLIGCDAVWPAHPMIADDELAGRAYLDVFDLTPEQWAARTAGMSGGEHATWELVRAIVDEHGTLNASFWRLDGSRKQALLNALARNAF